jgi:hypothetical protein
MFCCQAIQTTHMQLHERPHFQRYWTLLLSWKWPGCYCELWWLLHHSANLFSWITAKGEKHTVAVPSHAMARHARMFQACGNSPLASEATFFLWGHLYATHPTLPKNLKKALLPKPEELDLCKALTKNWICNSCFLKYSCTLLNQPRKCHILALHSVQGITVIYTHSCKNTDITWLPLTNSSLQIHFAMRIQNWNIHTVDNSADKYATYTCGLSKGRHLVLELYKIRIQNYSLHTIIHFT